MKHPQLGCVCVAVVTVWAVGGLARAEAPVYEGFAYAPTGSGLSGRSGGAGFIGPWVPGGFNASLSANFGIASDSLTFGPLVVTGNRVSSGAVNAIAGLTRPLAEPLGTTGTTRYFSFLVRPEGTLHGGAFNGFFGLVLDQPGEPELFVGKPGAGQIGQYVLEERGGPNQVSTGASLVVGQTSLLVVKAEFTAGLDRFTLYMNPTPGGAEPLAGTVHQASDIGLATHVTLYSTGAFSFDELRVGRTFAEVTPVPEPATLTAGVGFLAALLSRRRRVAGIVLRARAKGRRTRGKALDSRAAAHLEVGLRPVSGWIC